MNIAEPYCNWTLDKEANHAPILLLRNISVIVAVATLIAMPVIAHFTEHTSLTKACAFVMFFTCFISIIIYATTKSKASSAEIRCSLCKQNMSHVQHDYPDKPNAGLSAGAFEKHGADGRRYMMQSVGNATQWCRVLQELRVCKQCKRYIVINEAKMVPIGRTKRDVDEYEERLVQQRKAITGKKIIFKRK